MPAAPGTRWPERVGEGALLATFMLVACALAVVLDHPASAVSRLLPDPLARRALFGAGMGATAIALVYSPLGRRTGAHMNPAVTLAYLWLGRMRRRDAASYVAAQILGALAGVLAGWAVLGDRLAHEATHFVTTRPGEAGILPALVAEAVISFVLMAVVLAVSASRAERWTGVCAGALVALYIAVEAPLSGTSMNPARSIGSALPARELGALWIYLVAPPLGMLAAAAIVGRRLGRGCAKLRHDPTVPCVFCGRGRAPAPRRRAA